MVVFYDKEDVDPNWVHQIVDHPMLTIISWPPEGVKYSGEKGDKWSDPQRHKMLAGFVFIPAHHVNTPYWLKLDTDVVAIGEDDWIKPEWFEDEAAIISHKWTFTKPPDQIIKLDLWAEENGLLLESPPLDLRPEPGSDRVGHARIISWCAFFRADFTRHCSIIADRACGAFQLPVPSQDGYLWYMARRLNQKIVRTNMKGCGWQHWHTEKNIIKYAKEAMSL
jgi:hypothetical protein